MSGLCAKPGAQMLFKSSQNVYIPSVPTPIFIEDETEDQRCQEAGPRLPSKGTLESEFRSETSGSSSEGRKLHVAKSHESRP